MVLVDSSVWVAHLRTGNVGLGTLLSDTHVACHPFIVGELACGNLINRAEILSLLQALPMASHADHEEVMRFIENYHLMGKGLDVDMHLLSSALLTNIPLWTLTRDLTRLHHHWGYLLIFLTDNSSRNYIP
jgi:predicted nucleic acid-binding protein